MSAFTIAYSWSSTEGMRSLPSSHFHQKYQSRQWYVERENGDNQAAPKVDRHENLHGFLDGFQGPKFLLSKRELRSAECGLSYRSSGRTRFFDAIRRVVYGRKCDIGERRE